MALGVNLNHLKALGPENACPIFAYGASVKIEYGDEDRDQD